MDMLEHSSTHPLQRLRLVVGAGGLEGTALLLDDEAVEHHRVCAARSTRCGLVSVAWLRKTVTCSQAAASRVT